MALLGMRGSGSLAAAERPKNYRQGILLLHPNGDTVITGMLSRMREQSTDDAQYFWYEKGIPLQRAMIVGAAVDTTAVPASGADIAAANATAVIALRVTPTGGSANDTTIFKAGHVLFNEVANEVYLVIKKASVGGVDYLIVRRNLGNKYGAGSEPAVTGDATAGDTITIVGSGFPEGAPLGAAIAYQPVKHYNYTQIFRTPLFLTRTAKKTRLRWDSTGPYRESSREALSLHGIEMEHAFFFSERSENNSFTNPDAPLENTSTGMPLRTTRGILNWLPTATTSTVSVHTNLTSLNSGALTEDIADDFFEEVFRFGSGEKLLPCGSTAMNVISQLAKNKFTLEAVPRDEAYGLAIRRIITPFGIGYLVNHPLLSNNPVWRKDMYAIDMEKLSFRYVTDTVFLKNRQNPGDDASKDEWLTEAGLEMHFSGATPDDSDGLSAVAAPSAHGRLSGIASYGG